MKIVYHYANSCFDWWISEHQSVNPWREAISILSSKYKRFTFVHPVVISIIWTIQIQRHGKLLVKINYSFDKIKQRDLLLDGKSVSDLIAYLRLLRTTECSVHYRGTTAPSVLAGYKGDMKVYKLMTQKFLTKFYQHK